MPREASAVVQLKAELAAARARASTGTPHDSGARTRSGALHLRGTSAATASAPRTDTARQEAEARALAASERALSRKAAQYDRLAQGLGLVDEGLVDWDAKEDAAPSATPSPPPLGPEDPHDPIVEYVDDLGRTRTVRRSEVPREYLTGAADNADDDDDDDAAIYGPATSFPVFRRDVPQLDTSIAQRSDAVHFDADTDVRARGAAFFRFSHDEETRMAQQAELQARRAETIEQRAQQRGPTDDPVPRGVGAVRRDMRRQVIEAHLAGR